VELEGRMCGGWGGEYDDTTLRKEASPEEHRSCRWRASGPTEEGAGMMSDGSPGGPMTRRRLTASAEVEERRHLVSLCEPRGKVGRRQLIRTPRPQARRCWTSGAGRRRDVQVDAARCASFRSARRGSRRPQVAQIRGAHGWIYMRPALMGSWRCGLGRWCGELQQGGGGVEGEPYCEEGEGAWVTGA
jgi:hypothetical protein